MTVGQNKKAVAVAAAAAGGFDARGAAEPAEGCLPRLTGGEQPKPDSMSGEQSPNPIEYFSHFLTDGKGRLIEVPQRRGAVNGVFCDWLTFTFHQDTLIRCAGHPLVSDKEFMWVLSEKLEEILGFGITRKAKSKGNKFYESMYLLGSEDAEYGAVHFGGQRDTVLVELKGLGCNLASAGWETRLYRFMKTAIRCRITRCDLALDFFNGEYTPEQALLDHDNGFFNNHNMQPKRECRGTAWQKEDQTGKTLYIGRVKNARYVRIYEKGRQLGDKSSPWVRFEIQFNHGDIEIPFEILQDSGAYFSGAFPICQTFKNMPEAKRIAVREKTLNMTFEHKVKHGKNAVGALVRFMRDVGMEDGQIVEMLIAEDGRYPKGLEPARYDVNELLEAQKWGFIHNSPEAELSRETDEFLQWKVSGGYDPYESLFGLAGYRGEAQRRKEDEEYEKWLSKQLYNGLSESKKLEIAEKEGKALSRRIQIANSPYKFSLAYFINHRPKAVNTIKSFNCETLPERKNHV
ncbi:replication initiation factor domain-containing protein [Neisseria sp. Dent CA1/247]|nr:replication initiation factor domain-containing protein [Neisseria sp. Dent CA1/247]UOO77998.1 replication initiation factor domain-containing protein [Neisseria sp. Dent CA1/247]